MSAAFAVVGDQASGILHIRCQATFAVQWPAQRIAGVPCAEPARPPSECFGTQFLESRAVLAGRSVGILDPILFRDELASGRLVQPFDILGRSDIDGYWLVYPEARRNVPKIRAFREWILGEIAAGDQPPAFSATS